MAKRTRDAEGYYTEVAHDILPELDKKIKSIFQWLITDKDLDIVDAKALIMDSLHDITLIHIMDMRDKELNKNGNKK